MMTRREAVKKTAMAATFLAAVSVPESVKAQPVGAPAGPFKLPALPYPFDALEPHIDAKTMEIQGSPLLLGRVTPVERCAGSRRPEEKPSSVWQHGFRFDPLCTGVLRSKCKLCANAWFLIACLPDDARF